LIARVPLPPRFSFDSIVRSHGWYNLPPFEYDRERGVLSTYVEVGPLTPALSRGEREFSWRRIPLRGAPRSSNAPTSALSRKREKAVKVHFLVRNGNLEARADALEASGLRALARRVFSLDLDLSGAQRSFAHEPLLARALRARGGRMLRAPTLFEDAVKILFTTNCSWSATRGMVSRLIALVGAEGRAFPTPESVAKLSAATVERRVRCGYRAEALRLFAKRIASGKLDLSAWEDPARSSEEVRADIVSEHGFGPYAAEGLLRILGRHDFYALDSWTRQQYRRMYRGPAASTDRAIARRYARFGAHRGLALWLDMTRGWHQETPGEWPAPSQKPRLPNAE
jgi:N-glycosylase/DNA lyase